MQGKVKQTTRAKQHSTAKAVTFPKKNELPRVGLEPTTLCTLDRVLYSCTCGASELPTRRTVNLRHLMVLSVFTVMLNFPFSSTMTFSLNSISFPLLAEASSATITPRAGDPSAREACPCDLEG